jgi:hypothetical protein
MSSSCWRRYQDTLHYLQRECLINLVVVHNQGLLWRNRPPEFSHHWSSCSSAHTMTSVQCDHNAVWWEHDVHVSLSCKYRYRSLNRVRRVPGATRAMSVYRPYNIWARMEFWGTTASVSFGVENWPSTKASHYLSARKEAISIVRLVKNSNSDNLYSRPECHVVSKVLSISKNTVAVLKFRVTWSARLTLKCYTVICSKAKLTCI